MEKRWPHRHADADAELFVTPDKPAYDDGDAMVVDVRLVVLRPLSFSHMLVLLQADEVLEWRGFSSVSDTQDTRLVEAKMEVSPMPDEGRELAPGEYHFHATVTVPTGIPRFRYERGNCTAEIKTFVKGLLWTTDNPKIATLSTGHFFDLVPSNNLAPPVAESNYEAISSCDVRLLGVLSSGHCEVGIRLDRPGFQIDGDTVAQITIHSTQPKTKIKSVSLSLLEEAQILRKKKTTVTAVGSWDVPLHDNSVLAAGTASTASDSTLASVVTLRVDPNQVHKSVHLRLLIITHRLRVEITFHGGASGTIDYPPIPLLRD